jgi:hypothetical protein
LAMDLWPAEAVLPDGRVIQGARVQVTRGGQVVVWRDYTGVAQVVYAGFVLDHSRYPEHSALWFNRRATIAVEGGVLLVNQTGPGSCRCGGGVLYDLTEADAQRALTHA